MLANDPRLGLSTQGPKGAPSGGSGRLDFGNTPILGGFGGGPVGLGSGNNVRPNPVPQVGGGGQVPGHGNWVAGLPGGDARPSGGGGPELGRWGHPVGAFSKKNPWRGFDSAQEEFAALQKHYQRGVAGLPGGLGVMDKKIANARARGVESYGSSAVGDPLGFARALRKREKAGGFANEQQRATFMRNLENKFARPWSSGGARRFLGNSSLSEGVFQSRTDFIKARMQQLANVLGVPAFQHGGVVTKPTLAMVGEGGPEAIVPLQGLQGPQHGGFNPNQPPQLDMGGQGGFAPGGGAPPTGSQPNPASQAGGAGTNVMDLINQFRNMFPSGKSNLLDPGTNKAASDFFGKILKAAGGGGLNALKGQVGAVKAGDRMREMLQRNDPLVLGQSGVIQIGDGLAINVHTGEVVQGMSGGGDFNPGAGGDGGGDGGGGGGDLGGGSGGGAGGQPGFIGFLEDQLRNLFSGGFGIDQSVADAQRAALTSQSMRNQQAAMQGLEAQLNAAGALGGGRNIELGKQLSTAFNEDLLNSLAGFDMGLNQMSLQDRQATFGQGNDFARTLLQRELGLGDINVRNRGLDIQRELGLGDLDLRRLLGTGNLQLGRDQLGLQREGQMFNQGLQTFLTNMGLLG